MTIYGFLFFWWIAHNIYKLKSHVTVKTIETEVQKIIARIIMVKKKNKSNKLCIGLNHWLRLYIAQTNYRNLLNYSDSLHRILFRFVEIVTHQWCSSCYRVYWFRTRFITFKIDMLVTCTGRTYNWQFQNAANLIVPLCNRLV